MHWVTVKSSSDLTIFLQAIREQPSARVVNAIEASVSKYIQVRAILFKDIESMLDCQSNNICGGSVKSIENNEMGSVYSICLFRNCSLLYLK